jgi:hypothetical protein
LRLRLQKIIHTLKGPCSFTIAGAFYIYSLHIIPANTLSLNQKSSKALLPQGGKSLYFIHLMEANHLTTVIFPYTFLGLKIF